MCDCIPLIAVPPGGKWLAIAWGKNIHIFQTYEFCLAVPENVDGEVPPCRMFVRQQSRSSVAAAATASP